MARFPSETVAIIAIALVTAFRFRREGFFFDNLRWGADPINHHNKYPLPHGDASSTATPIELDRNDESPTSSTTKTPTATPTNASASTGKASAITAQKQPQQKQQTPIELDTNDDTQTESSTSSSTKTPTATPTNASASTSKASAITTQKQQKQQQLQHNEDDDNNWPPTQILDRIVDEERRMVITFVNCGYIKFADNWVVHLEKLGITNYALVPLDEKNAFDFGRNFLRGTHTARTTLSGGDGKKPNYFEHIECCEWCEYVRFERVPGIDDATPPHTGINSAKKLHNVLQRCRHSLGPQRLGLL